MRFTTRDSMNDPEGLADTVWQKHLAKFGNPFGLLLAAADLPIQLTAEDDPTTVLRLAASPPIELIQPIPHNATAWAFLARKEESGWYIAWVVPLYQKGPSGLWLFDRHVSDEMMRRVA